MARLLAGALLLSALAAPACLSAQSSAPVPQRQASVFSEPGSQEIKDANERMTTSGFFLGVVGMLGGAAVGSGIGSARCGHDCVTRSASGGAALAGAILIPIGVHIAADKPKNLLLSMAASIAAGSLVWAGFNLVPGRPVALAPFVAAPLQVWTALEIEK